MDELTCPRCGAVMVLEKIITDMGESCVSWGCYRCGEVIDPQILINRGMERPAGKGAVKSWA